MMDGMLSTYLEQVKDRVNSCEEFYELQQQQWQESIRLRTEEGIVKTLVGVGTMILGGMLVVATCGMALPLVATVGVMAIGAGTAAYGFSNTVEGGQDVYAGVTGDPRMVSVNPIRDTVFASNPELYYLIGNVLTIAASLILTGGMAANAAVSAGTSIGRAVVTEYAKQGLTVAASSYVEKSMTEATNSPLAGFVVGSLTGIATYGTLSELDTMANVSGLHSSFAEGMSKEDAQKYLDFLENGSKEGLTEAEIRGIGKVDEALALKKVNPEELLELRKQQLGNVGETSYGKSTLISLKNTENFTDSAIEHIFEGQVNARGKAVGYHYEGIEGTSSGGIEMKYRIEEYKLKNGIEDISIIFDEKYQLLTTFMSCDVLPFEKWIKSGFDRVLSGKSEYEEVNGNVCCAEISPKTTKVYDNLAEDAMGNWCEVDTKELRQLIDEWCDKVQKFKMSITTKPPHRQA